jgi:hypothetical protein
MFANQVTEACHSQRLSPVTQLVPTGAILARRSCKAALRNARVARIILPERTAEARRTLASSIAVVLPLRAGRRSLIGSKNAYSAG